MTLQRILPKGIYQDRLVRAENQIIDFGWNSNIIVDRCRYLLAAFMKGDTSSGIQTLKVGRGLESWDNISPEPPTRIIEQLTDPSPIDIPIGSSQIEYLDATGNSTPGPTQRLRITLTLGVDSPPVASGKTSYPLREFGIFGLFGTEEYMIDYVRHPVIHKQAADILDRTIHLIF